MADGSTQQTRPLWEQVGDVLLDPFSPSQPAAATRPAVPPLAATSPRTPVAAGPSVMERVGSAVLDPLSSGRQAPGAAEAMRFTRTADPNIINVDGRDVPRSTIEKMAAQGVPWAVQAQRLVPKRQVPVPGAAPGMAPGAPPGVAPRATPGQARPMDPRRVLVPSRTFERSLGRRVQTQQQALPQLTQKGLEMQLQALENQTEVAKAQGEARLELRKQENDFALREAEINQEYAAQQMHRNLRQQELMREQKDKRERVLGEVGQMEIRNFWADKSTADKVLAAIGLTLGAFAQAAGAGPNPALQVIDRAIAHDLEIQKSRIATGRARLEDIGGVMAKMQLEYDDDIQSLNMARLASIQMVRDQAKAMEASAQREDDKAALKNLDNALLERQGQLLAEAGGIEQINTVEELRTVTTPAITVGDIVSREEERKGSIPFEKGKTDMFVREYQGFAPTESEAKDMRRLASDGKTLRSFLTRLIAFREKYGAEVLPTEAAAEAEALHSEAELLQKDLKNLGVLAGEDLPIIRTGIPKPGQKWPGTAARYKTVIKTSQINEKNRAYQTIRPAHNVPLYLQRGTATSVGSPMEQDIGFERKVGQTD